MPYAKQHKRRKQRKAQKRHRTGNFIPCPCSLCLNRVHLDGSDVNRHVALYGLAHSASTSSSVIVNPEKEASLAASSMISEDHKTDSSAISPLPALPTDDETGSNSCSSPKSARGHREVNDHEETSDISTSETRVKEEPNRTHFITGRVSDGISLSPEAKITTGEDADHDHDNSSVTERSSYSLEEDFLPSLAASESSNGSSDILESEEEIKDLPDYLRETTYTEEEELYNSDKAKLPLFDGSSVTVLQALCGYLAWFSEHPGTSKTSLSDLLRLHHEQILPTGNNLPGSYDEAHAFVKPFLLPFVVYDVCPNDCVLFRKTDHYDYSKLAECPSPKCNGNRYTANRSAARKFYYYPLGPRWKRMYGNATIAEVLQSHDRNIHPTVNVNDIIGSKSWCKAYSPQGFFKGEKRGVSAQLSTDGVNPFSSNKVVYSMWPIMLTVLNLPKRIRNLFSNMMLVGIIPGNGNQEPKHLDPFLEVVVDELLSLSGSTFYDGYKKAPFEFKVQLLSYVLDYPGLNKVFLSTGANALQGCMWCDIRGKLSFFGH